MKKAIFAVLVMLVAMLAVTCDSALMPGKLSSGTGKPDQVTPGQPSQITPDEPGAVTVTINLPDDSGARAMTLGQATADVDFYEVVFKTANTTIRSAKKIGDIALWSVTVPAVNYDSDTTNNAIVLFAGKEDIISAAGSEKHTLLAIAEAKEDLSAKANLTSSISFELNAIRSGVNQVTTGPTASSFLITGTHVNATIDSKTVGSLSYPVFSIPNNNETDILAEWTFRMTNPYYKHAVLNGLPSFASAPVTGVPNTSGISVSTSVISPTSGAIGTNTAVFSIQIITNEAAGLTKLSITVPVRAINSVATVGGSWASEPYKNWVIQGGTSNTDLDGQLTGAPASGSTGGAVLLEVVEHPTTVEPGGITPET